MTIYRLGADLFDLPAWRRTSKSILALVRQAGYMLPKGRVSVDISPDTIHLCDRQTGRLLYTLYRFDL